MPTLIDTRDAFRRLREEGGFSEQEADAIVDLFRDADEEVATRSDIEELDERLTQRIELSEERLGQQIERAEKRLLKWILGGFGAVAGVVTVLNYVVG